VLGRFTASLMVRDLPRRTGRGSPSMSMGLFAWWDVGPPCHDLLVWECVDVRTVRGSGLPGRSGLSKRLLQAGLSSRV